MPFEESPQYKRFNESVSASLEADSVSLVGRSCRNMDTDSGQIEQGKDAQVLNPLGENFVSDNVSIVGSLCTDNALFLQVPARAKKTARVVGRRGCMR